MDTPLPRADIVNWDMLEVITIVESSHDLIDSYYMCDCGNIRRRLARHGSHSRAYHHTALSTGSIHINSEQHTHTLHRTYIYIQLTSSLLLFDPIPR
jgi:hypothetical protein